MSSSKNDAPLTGNTGPAVCHKRSRDDDNIVMEDRDIEPPPCRFEKRARTNTMDEFMATCERLRRNDPTLTALPGPYSCPYGYAQALGTAIQGNTHVTSADVHIDRLFPMIEGKKEVNLKTVAPYVAQLVDYIETSPTLRRFRIEGYHEDDDVNELLAELFLDAAFENKGVEELTLDLSRFPYTAFMPETTCPALLSLHLFFDRAQYFDATERRTIRNALVHFPSLTNVTVSTSDEQLAESILVGIRKGKCCHTLNELVLRFQRGGHPTRLFWSSLKAIVQSDATKPFRNLTLDGVEFNAESMAGFVKVLKRPRKNSTSLTSVSELSLDTCRFDEEARQLLVAFMQTRVVSKLPRHVQGDEDGGDRRSSDITTPTSSLKKLDLDFEDGLDENMCRDLSGACLVSMLSMGQGVAATADRNVPTIGSHIESISVYPIRKCFPRFLQHLARNADAIRLKELTVPVLETEADTRALAQCIDCIPSLQAVAISLHDYYGSAEPILVSLKRNGTILKAQVDESSSSREYTAKLAQAFAVRNQFLDPLLLEATAKTSSESLSSLVVDNTTSTCPNDQLQSNKKSFSLTLLQSAQQIPKTKSSSVLRSMLRLDDSIGDDLLVDSCG